MGRTAASAPRETTNPLRPVALGIRAPDKAHQLFQREPAASAWPRLSPAQPPCRRSAAYESILRSPISVGPAATSPRSPHRPHARGGVARRLTNSSVSTSDAAVGCFYACRFLRQRIAAVVSDR